MITAQEIEKRLATILPRVEKPGRYTGGELNQVVKDWQAVKTHIALVFPDIYDLGMSNLGLAILYETLNRRVDTLAERAFSPWLDMEAEMRQQGLPLFSLETKHPLAMFDIIGFSLPYETLYTNTLNLLDLAGLPLFSAERNETHPLIIAGGHATFNPEPMHAFIDAFAIGEGEEVIHEIVDCYQNWREKGKHRYALLHDLACLQGVYVPSLYRVNYLPDGRVARVKPLSKVAALPVIKRIVTQLPPPPTRFIVPYIDITHNRIPVEIMRGCIRGCRFCQAGMVTRPVRQRPLAEVITAIEEGLRATGYEEVGLLSLSSSDYTQVVELVQTINQRFSNSHLNISLPSLRIESLSLDLIEALHGSKHHGFTLAPEAASEGLRQVINKPLNSNQLLDIAAQIYARGWTTIKLYFMIGHPTETIDDVMAIIDLCQAILSTGWKNLGKRAKLHVSLSTFIPKPHTPFQWAACNNAEEIRLKQGLIRRGLHDANIKLTWTAPEETILEASLSRGDRRLSDVIYIAWKCGARFDAWRDQFNPSLWQTAFDQAGLSSEFYAQRVRSEDEIFPWDHINIGVRKNYLLQDYRWSLKARVRPDCRQHCYSCGILATFNHLRQGSPAEAWVCPPIANEEE